MGIERDGDPNRADLAVCTWAPVTEPPNELADVSEEQLAANQGSGYAGRSSVTEGVITLPTGVC